MVQPVFFLIFANSLILTADSLFNLFFHHDWTAFLYDDIICRKNILYLQNLLNYAKNNMFQNYFFFILGILKPDTMYFWYMHTQLSHI